MSLRTCTAVKIGRPCTADLSPRAERLRSAFPAAKLRRERDARALGISTSHLRKIVNGGQRPSPDLAVKIAAYRGIPLRVVLDLRIPAGVVL